MYVVWTCLAVLYGWNTVQLISQGDGSGALIVGVLAAMFVFIGWRNFQKRKRRRAEKVKTRLKYSGQGGKLP